MHDFQTSRRAAALLVTTIVAANAPVPAWGQDAADARTGDTMEERRRHQSADIIVTSRSLETERTALPVQVLTGDELAHRRQGGLGETLAGLPGIHLDNFGGGASRPVIRGQTLPRIEVLTDGANLFDVSSVSPDHAITTDPLLLDAIEIQRGPAAVRYGGNATNGAINLIDSKVPKSVPTGGMTGAVEARYGTGDEEKAIVGRVTAGLGQFALHAEGARRDANNYNVPDAYGSGELRDSFAESTSYAVGGSWITGTGYFGAAYSRMESEYGLPGHSHANGVCHTHYYSSRLDLHCKGHAQYVDPITTPDSHTAFIRLHSDRFDLRADYDDLLPEIAHLRLRGSYTDYKHDEIDGSSLFTRYTNEVWDGRIELTHAPIFGFTGTVGVQYTHSTFSGLNVNDLHLGGIVVGYFGSDAYFRSPYDYITETGGIFLNESRSFGPVDVEFGIRQDWRTITIPQTEFVMTTELQEFIPAYEANWGLPFEQILRQNFADSNPGAKHDPLSASVAATWNVNTDYAASLVLSHTERAPNVRELYANGNNMATNSYELGLANSPGSFITPDFWPDFPVTFPPATTDTTEKTDSINLTLRKQTGPTRFELGLFHQEVDNYIFARFLDTDSETGVSHNWLVYTAADATFTGVDGQASHEFQPGSRLTIFGDYVEARLKSQDDNLPRIPPGRLGMRYEHAAGPISGDVEYYHTFEQDRVASYETRTAGYDMLNATLSYRFELGRGVRAELYARGTNLLNELALVHTSFVKDQSPLRGRNVVIGARYAF